MKTDRRSPWEGHPHCSTARTRLFSDIKHIIINNLIRRLSSGGHVYGSTPYTCGPLHSSMHAYSTRPRACVVCRADIAPGPVHAFVASLLRSALLWAPQVSRVHSASAERGLII